MSARLQKIQIQKTDMGFSLNVDLDESSIEGNLSLLMKVVKSKDKGYSLDYFCLNEDKVKQTPLEKGILFDTFVSEKPFEAGFKEATIEEPMVYRCHRCKAPLTC